MCRKRNVTLFFVVVSFNVEYSAEPHFFWIRYLQNNLTLIMFQCLILIYGNIHILSFTDEKVPNKTQYKDIFSSSVSNDKYNFTYSR